MAPNDHPADGGRRGDGPHLLIVEARFYDDISDLLLTGARGALEAAGATSERVVVPGALEIPAALRLAIDAGAYDAFVSAVAMNQPMDPKALVVPMNQQSFGKLNIRASSRGSRTSRYAPAMSAESTAITSTA